MLKILVKNRNFRYLWTGQLISALGDRLTQMGILTFVLILSRDNGSKMALITFFSLLPFLLFGPLFGALVDRYSRKKLMLFADIMRAALVAFMPIIWMNTHSLALVILLIFLLGALSALFAPAKMSIITNITDKDVLLQANSLIVTTGMVATLVGTLIAGAVIKITGVKVGFYINSLTYIISAIFIWNIFYQKPSRVPEIAKDEYLTLVDDIKVGITYIRRHRLIIRLIMLSTVFSIMTSFAYILILNYSTSFLRQGPLGMGVMLSSAGFGMIVGSLILIKRKERVNYKRALYLSHFIMGLFLIAFIFGPTFYVALAVLFGAGIGAAILTIALDTIFQRISPDELKGKIFAARGVLTNATFLISLLLVGLLVKFVSAKVLFGVIGLLGLFTALAIFLSEQRWGYQLLRFFLKILLKALFNFKVSGLENIPKRKRVVLAGNHTSVIDGVVLMCAYKERIYFLVADSLFRTKFWGWCARRLGYISVKRGGFNMEAVKKAVHILHSGYSVGIFPEGKIAPDGQLTEGKEGVAVIAKLAKADIIPFAIEGAYEAWPLPQRFPRRFPIEVRFGKPIDTKDYPAPEDLAQDVMEEIAKVKLSLEREGYLRAEPDEIIRHIINIG